MARECGSLTGSLVFNRNGSALSTRIGFRSLLRMEDLRQMRAEFGRPCTPTTVRTFPLMTLRRSVGNFAEWGCNLFVSQNTLSQGVLRINTTRLGRARVYDGIRGKVLDRIEHQFEEGRLYLHVCFRDKTEVNFTLSSRSSLRKPC